jgi:phosphate butyryltransferase
MVIRSFDTLAAAMRRRPPLRVVLAGADDEGALAALAQGAAEGLVREAILVGDPARIASLLPEGLAGCARVVAAGDPAAMAAASVAAARAGEADLLAKGRIDSAAYLRAVVARDTGIRAGGVLSNLTLAEMPSVPRLLGATDTGIVPLPTLEQKRAILANARPLFAGLGLAEVRVAAIAASEKVSEAQPATVDAAALAAESRAGALPGLIVDGPFGYDVALSPQAAAAKGLEASPVAGRADLILFPNLEAGNATLKAWKLHGAARTASLVIGAAVPVLLNSRSDGAEQRRLGLLLAQALIAGREALSGQEPTH